MFIKVISFEPMTDSFLTPTPNIRELQYISELLRSNTVPEITNLATAGPIEIITNYHGSMLYCAGGVSVYRYSSQTFNRYWHVTEPFDGLEENVYIMTDLGNFKARIQFFS